MAAGRHRRDVEDAGGLGAGDDRQTAEALAERPRLVDSGQSGLEGPSGFILLHDPIINSIGLAFAAGILIDAWLPRWLDRILPNVDIDGASLEQHTTAEPRTLVGAGI